jgi:mannose-6-phosphate isomerase-like protein (cupin superfamily)
MTEVVERFSEQVFVYQRPELGDRKKVVVLLARTDVAFCAVQIVREGGENNLHSHANQDGFWFVLAGRARFYTTGDELIGDLGPNEGIVVPRGYPYWFESSGDEQLEILQVEASPKGLGEDLGADRVDHEPLKPSMDDAVTEGGSR